MPGLKTCTMNPKLYPSLFYSFIALTLSGCRASHSTVYTQPGKDHKDGDNNGKTDENKKDQDDKDDKDKNAYRNNDEKDNDRKESK